MSTFCSRPLNLVRRAGQFLRKGIDALLRRALDTGKAML
jgi:hypothetical protein